MLVASDTLGRRVRRLRLDRGLGSRALSRLLGYSETYIADVERDKIQSLPLDVTRRLSVIFNVSQGYLLGVDDSAARMHDDLAASVLGLIPVEVPVVRGLVMEDGELRAGEAVSRVFVEPERRGRDLLAFVVDGDWLAPRIERGDTVVVDRQLAVRPGEVAVALEGSRTVVKRVERVGTRLCLVSENGEPEVPVGDEAVIYGVGIDVVKSLRKG